MGLGAPNQSPSGAFAVVGLAAWENWGERQPGAEPPGADRGEGGPRQTWMGTVSRAARMEKCRSALGSRCFGIPFAACCRITGLCGEEALLEPQECPRG